MDVPSSPPGLAGAAAVKSRHRQGQGFPPCLSPCDVFVWACSPHKQRDLKGKSRAAATHVAWSQSRASSQLWEERSSSPMVGVGCAGTCVVSRKRRESLPLAGVQEKPWWAAALSRARTVLLACPKQTMEAHVLRQHHSVQRGEGLTSKGSQPLHHSRMSPDRHNALSGFTSCASHKRTEPPLHHCHRGV